MYKWQKKLHIIAPLLPTHLMMLCNACVHTEMNAYMQKPEYPTTTVQKLHICSNVQNSLHNLKTVCVE